MFRKDKNKGVKASQAEDYKLRKEGRKERKKKKKKRGRARIEKTIIKEQSLK